MSGHADGTHSQESDMLFVLALCGFSGALYPWLSRKRSPLARFLPKYNLRSPLWPHTVSQKTAQPAAGAKLMAQSDEYGICKPVSARTGEYGCWIVAQQPLGELTSSQVF